MLENSPRLESSTRFAEKHSSTTQAAKEINYSQQIGESLGFPSSMDNPREQMKPETCAETSAAESSMNLTDDRPNQPFIAHALKCPSRRRECVAKGTSYTVTPTTAAKRLDSTKYGEGAISKQYLDERWADLVAVLRAQKLGTQTVKGGALPSDAAVQKIQLKRAEEVQRMLRLLQIQDRNRSSCVFAGAPVAPSRTATQSTLHSTCSSQEKGSMVRKLWRSELIIRFQQAAAAVVLRTRMARRLEAIRSWIRSHNLREEANQPGAPEKQHQNGPSNCLNSPQHPGHDLEKGFHQRAPVHTNTPQQNEKFVGGLPKCQGNASLAGSTVVEVPTVVKSVEGSAGLQGQESHGVTDEYRWRVKLVPPRFSFLADSNGEWEWQSIPGPEFWGKENLNVAELFTCMQHNAPLSALSKRDVDVFHLKEEDVITCTGGLEVTDMDLLQSLLDATPPLIDDKTWVRCMPSSKHALDDAKTSLTTRSRSQGVNGTLDTAGLLPPEEPSALAAVAWRFVASAPPYSSACMQVPHIIETDLAYIILQAAAQAETNHAAENILPPFSEIPPLRCSMSELNSVAAGALWPPGAHQTLIRASHRSFDEQGGDKRRESAGIDALEPTEEKDSHALAFEECVNRADALKRDSKILASIWGLARCEQVELLSGVNRTLPQEFQIPYL
ncbi:hypothetical protein, conserved [Eimeria praecox]|uniref:Uncharacterized protein n=1 Tax=Eimeria praecox TaxID=51316 RepID=U6H3B4_9EIME|nr:hypothetical protein, conserved [Eimeria praecox]